MLVPSSVHIIQKNTGTMLGYTEAWTGALKMCSHMWKHVQFPQNLLLNSARNTATHSLTKAYTEELLHAHVVHFTVRVSKIKLTFQTLFNLLLVSCNSCSVFI